MKPPVERFWAKVEKGKDDECWNWTGGISDGYGFFKIKGHQRIKAHRFIYMHTVGSIPQGLTLDHLCRNRRCVNPKHLEAVSNRVNILRGKSLAAQNAARTHCIHGHAFDLWNTYYRANGARSCKACLLIRQRQYRLEAKFGKRPNAS